MSAAGQKILSACGFVPPPSLSAVNTGCCPAALDAAIATGKCVRFEPGTSPVVVQPNGVTIESIAIAIVATTGRIEPKLKLRGGCKHHLPRIRMLQIYQRRTGLRMQRVEIDGHRLLRLEGRGLWNDEQTNTADCYGKYKNSRMHRQASWLAPPPDGDPIPTAI